jgi:hypothetical protein
MSRHLPQVVIRTLPTWNDEPSIKEALVLKELMLAYHRTVHVHSERREHDAMSDPRVLNEHYAARRRSVERGENDCRFCH